MAQPLLLGSHWLKQGRDSTNRMEDTNHYLGEKRTDCTELLKRWPNQAKRQWERGEKRGISILVKGRISVKETPCGHRDGPSDKCTTLPVVPDFVSGRKSGCLSEILLFEVTKARFPTQRKPWHHGK